MEFPIFPPRPKALRSFIVLCGDRATSAASPLKRHVHFRSSSHATIVASLSERRHQPGRPTRSLRWCLPNSLRLLRTINWTSSKSLPHSNLGPTRTRASMHLRCRSEVTIMASVPQFSRQCFSRSAHAGFRLHPVRQFENESPNFHV